MRQASQTLPKFRRSGSANWHILQRANNQARPAKTYVRHESSAGFSPVLDALWLETATQAAVQQEWMVGLGRRTAQTRLAHFLCELSYRLQLNGRNDLDAFEFPLTQRELADVLGLSTVHVNRVLQTLRSLGMIELSRNQRMILNKAGLYEIAEFDSGYLHGMQLAD
jgi:biotin operon repressor